MRVGLFSNTLGHCAGVAVFSLLLYLFLIDWKRSERLRSGLSAIAATLGLIWNVGDLLALDPGISQYPAFHVLHAFAFSALSFFPAVLLHIWLQARDRYLWSVGYVLSLVAAILQIRADLTKPLLAYHVPSLLLIVIGFSGLTIICLRQSLRQPGFRRAGGDLAAAMLLLLAAIFFVSYDDPQAVHFHHFGMPLSMFVLLFDFCFLIWDAVSRFFMRTILVACGTVLSLVAALQFHFVAQNPFWAALDFAAIMGSLFAILQLSALGERLTAWFLLRHSRLESILATLRDYPVTEYNDDEYLDHARSAIETFFQCAVSELRYPLQSPELEAFLGPVALLENSRRSILNPLSWAETMLPLRFTDGDGRLLRLGLRRGQRPYRQEDLLALARFGKIIEEHVESKRKLQTQAVASHAELRALQAQINPHFFFNSLNTLYAVISRDNTEAKRLVLNLAEVFQYILRSDRTFVSLKQELAIINSYLEIEKLRLGPRLTTSIQVDKDLLEAEIPVLSIQPLVENAVKHGVAPYSTNGLVNVTIKCENARLKIEVANTGQFGSSRSLDGTGVGLDNVRRRLALCYGFESELHICSKDNLTLVCCSIPLSIAAPNGRPKPILGNTGPDRIMEQTA